MAGKQPLDTTIRIVTPENVAFEYRLAGPFRRALAIAVDLLVQGGILFGLLQLLLFTGFQAGLGFLLVAAFIVFWGYGGLFEAYWIGQTPGKRTLGIRVVSTGGLQITGQQAMIRNLLRVAELTCYLLPAALSMLVTRRFQRLGDLAADTMVVIEESHLLKPAAIPPSRQLQEIAELLPVAFQPDRQMAQAVASYVTRRNSFGVARRYEMAGHLAEPLLRRLRLPSNLDADLLLCAVYNRVYS